MNVLLSSIVVATSVVSFSDEPVADSPGEETVQAEPGVGVGFDISTGLRGTLSYVELGVAFPQFFPHFTTGLKLVGMSATNWATFHDYETDQTVSLHPVILGGIVSFGGTSELKKDLFKVHGGCDILVGTAITPYETAFYDRSDFLSSNLSYGVWGTFGLEFFTSDSSSIFFDGGGGFRSYKLAVENQYAVAAAWLGSGFMLKIGTRFYL